MDKAVSLFGIVVQILILYALSTNRKKINWVLVCTGLFLQFVFALVILKTSIGAQFFSSMNDVIVSLLGFTQKGASFVFGNLTQLNIPVGTAIPGPPPGMADIAPALGTDALWARPAAYFAFGVLPTIIFFSSFMTILYHLGIMQRIVQFVAVIMQKTMKTSGAESLSAAANIFVGQTEAPLVIKPYVDRMTFSELNCIMTGGMATIAGGVMAAYVGMLMSKFPDIAGHLMAASVMSAPAALVCAKIMVPEEGVPETAGTCELKVESIDQNVIDAAARGASEGMSLAINVAAMLIAFIALIELGNHVWGLGVNALGNVAGFDVSKFNSLSKIVGLLASPFAFLMGIPSHDLIPAGQLLGEKTIINEFVAYAHLGDYIHGKVLNPDGSVVELSRRTVVILTYALCGFSNFGSIGIQLGGIGGLAPHRRHELAKLGLRALLAGTFACFMTANIAGVLID